MKSKSSGRNHPLDSSSGDSSPLPDRKSDLLIAAVGASAGGIEAFTELISNLATDTGMAFDHFMRALAEGQGNHAIGVLLSGSGTDGTAGLGEIQAHGGVTFAQDEQSAKYDSMPGSAVAAGCVDYVLPPKAIARELTRIARHPYLVRDQGPELAPAENTGLNLVFNLLRKSTGVDFTHYRQTT